MFEVGTTGSLTLNNLVITNGFTTGKGGAILYQGTLVLQGVTVKDSTANFDFGGADLTIRAFLSISNSTITNNTALWSGGGIQTVAGSVTVVIPPSATTA